MISIHNAAYVFKFKGNYSNLVSHLFRKRYWSVFWDRLEIIFTEVENDLRFIFVYKRISR